MKQTKYLYMGKIQAVIFDWAGTTIDYGSLAPVNAFCELFKSHHVAITLSEARAPMGVEKREHIRQLLLIPRIQQAWLDTHRMVPDDNVIDQLYNEFIPIQKVSIAERSELIPGVKAVFDYLIAHGIKVGANTGYSQEMITDMRQTATAQGYKPASVVCATDVFRGRPFPDMLLKNMHELEVSAVQSVIKVDDTIAGIQEGLNAGCWTVGVTITGNEVGLDLPEWNKMSIEQQQILRSTAYERLHNAGAHFVVDSVAELPKIIANIEKKLSNGEQP
ncbi:phosphonoacetaldehyde hydrolase [Neptunomonas japonica]|uniref:Phosphonoacetaldehyde hydrolase n=1 Tax=Neptunomonas japonica JAMM 1380 TaxID=1441457 RepID=A0A7R6SWK2_9GAMM|nr:phosphonoacetaldehyde hydrolase [Neptunomonas japonica]BBB29807.1 phosphonoacetaldehyde hydrolase [Neptunomonas japonica JAMM 1380]